MTRCAVLALLAALAAAAPAGARDMAKVRDRAVRWAVAHAGLRERGLTNVSNAVQVERRGVQYPVLAARVTG